MPIRVALPAIVAALAGHAAVLAIWPEAHTLLIDLLVYRAGAEHVLAGQPLYAGPVLLDLPFVYPPFAALAFVPLTLLPAGLLKVAWTAATLALLAYVVRRAHPGEWPSGSAALVALATWLDPVRTTLYLGQINVLVMALVLADVLGRREGRWRGVGVGLAAALKLTPLLFVLYLLLIGRVRAAAVAVATFLAAAALGAVVAPGDSVTYWLRGTFAAADRISDVAATTNHSLAGLLARALREGPAATWAYLAGAVLLTAAALTAAVRAHRRGAEVLGLALCGLCSAAIAPFAWSHHWVWFVPLVVVLLVRTAGTRGRAAGIGLVGMLAATAAVITALPGPGVGPIPRTGLISLAPDTYLLVFVAVVATVLYRQRGDRRCGEGPADRPAGPSSRSRPLSR